MSLLSLKAMDALERLPRLALFETNARQANDSVFGRFGNLPHLAELRLWNASGFKERGFAALSKLPLKILFLSGVRAPAAAESWGLIGSIPTLKDLTLHWDCAIGNDDLPGLARSQSLVRLDLHQAKITDAGLEHLRGMASLRYLSVWDTGVTEAGAKRLAEALPRCEIVYGKEKSKSVIKAREQARTHQEAWAKLLGVEIESPTSVGGTMVLIPPCSEKPFYMGKYEVTGHWQSAAGHCAVLTKRRQGPDHHDNKDGFRVARAAAGNSKEAKVAAGDPDRRAAETLLPHVQELDLRLPDGKEVQVKLGGRLSDGPFELVAIRFSLALN